MVSCLITAYMVRKQYQGDSLAGRLHSLATSWLYLWAGNTEDIKLNRWIPYSSWQFHMQHSVCLKIPYFVTKGNSCYKESLIVWQGHGEDGFLVVAKGPVVLPALPVPFVTRHRIVTGDKQKHAVVMETNVSIVCQNVKMKVNSKIYKKMENVKV